MKALTYHTTKATLLLVLCALVSCKKDKPGFSLVWHYEYTRPAESLSLVRIAPAILDKERILIAPDEQLTVLNRANGNLVHAIPLVNNPYIGVNEFLIDSEHLFLKENTNENIYGIDLSTGSINWTVRAPEELHHWPNDAMDRDWLYISSLYGKIFRYSKQGRLDKTYSVYPVYGIDTSVRSIRVLGDQLIFSQRWRGTDDCARTCGRILSIHKESEEVLWEYRTDQGGYISEPILLEDGVIYAGVTDGPGEFVALDATNGEVVWKTDGVVSHSYTLTDSMVLVNDGGSLLALDKLTGKELWNTERAFGGGHGQANIGYWNGYVYHYHSGSVWILDGQTGEVVHEGTATSPDGSSFYLLTVGGDGKIYIQSDYALYAYTAWR